MKCELIYAEPVVYYILDSDANKANSSSSVGYLRIRNFDDSAAASVKTAVAALQDSGATSLIIDVRDNTSGKPAEMADALDYFLPKGDLFLLRDRDGKETTYSSGSSYLNMPMVVLVNENTTCAAEVFACIMQQAGVTIVGRRTPGSAQSQVIVELSDGSAVRLSKFEYLTPDKKEHDRPWRRHAGYRVLPDRGQRSGRAARGGKGRPALTASTRENSAEIYKEGTKVPS